MSVSLKPTGAAPGFDVNRDWAVPRLWDVARIRSEKNHPELPLLSVFLNRGVIEYGDSGERRVHKPGLDLSVYQVVHRGDFVLNNQQAWRGSVGVSKSHGIISPAYVVLALGEALNPLFADFLFQSRDMVAQYVTSSKGVGDIQRDIHIPWLKNVKVPLPPLAEQAAIVRFLDGVTGRLARAIRAKRKVIGLLKEQKQAVIHQAVTRGLDTAVPLKPSGIPWLGDIPQHWEIVPSKALFKHRRQKALAEDEMLTASQAYGVISRKEFMAIEGRRVMQVITGSDILNHVEPNDFVMSMRSFQGGLEWSRVRGAISSAYVMLIPTNEVHPPYFAHLLKSWAYRTALRKTSDLVRDGQALRYANFGQVPLPLVPISEQRVIAESLDESVADIALAISCLEREIELLREYRTRLVADVVTGTLDVRDAAARLPDEAGPDFVDDDVDLSIDPEAADQEIAV